MADLTVRATVRVLDLKPGEIVVVDPTDPYISKLIKAGWLVPVEVDAG